MLTAQKSSFTTIAITAAICLSVCSLIVSFVSVNQARNAPIVQTTKGLHAALVGQIALIAYLEPGTDRLTFEQGVLRYADSKWIAFGLLVDDAGATPNQAESVDPPSKPSPANARRQQLTDSKDGYIGKTDWIPVSRVQLIEVIH